MLFQTGATRQRRAAVGASVVRGAQAWLKSQISALKAAHGVWPNSGPASQAVRFLGGASATYVLPVIITPAEAANLFRTLVVKTNQILFDEDHASAAADPVLGTARLVLPELAAIIAGHDPVTGDATLTTRAIIAQMDAANPLGVPVAPVNVPPGRLTPSGFPIDPSTTFPTDRFVEEAPPMPARIGPDTVLTPQATYDFFYYVDKLAIGLDSLYGIESDGSLLWWAIVETAKEVARVVKQAAGTGLSIGLVIAGVLGAGALVLIAADRR